MDDRSFRRAAGIAAIVSAPLAIGSAVTGMAAVHFNFAAMSDPMLLLQAGAGAAGLWRTSLMLDLFGYYLLIVPLVLALTAAFRPRAGAWSDLFGVCLLAYSLVGAIGAAMLAMATPPIMAAYTGAAPAQQPALAAAFAAQANDVYEGLWNLLETFLGGVGWIGFGALLWSGGRWVAGLTLLLGLASLVDSLGKITGQEWLSFVGLNAYLVLATVWPLVMGVRLFGGRELGSALSRGSAGFTATTPPA